MPNPFWSALMPSLSQSATGGAVGALEGQMAGEDRQLANQLKQAQIDQAKAHAYYYTHNQKMSQMAAAKLQEMLAKNPEALNTPEGRMYAYGAYGHFDPRVQDARANAFDQQAFANTMLGGQRAAQAGQISALTDPKVASTYAQAMERSSLGNLATTRASDLMATQPSRVDLTKARTATESARQKLFANQASLAAARAAVQKQLAGAGAGGKAPNLYSMADTYLKKIQAARASGVDPDENDVAMLEALMEKIAGPEFVPMPLGSDTMGSKLTGQKAQPAVPEQPGGFLSKPVPAVPGTPPTRKPLALTPKARPGKVDHEQAVLKARKLITERGVKFAEEQLKSNKALTPTEKLALQEALLLEAGQR